VIWYEVHISVNERPGGLGTQSYEHALANAKKLEIQLSLTEAIKKAYVKILLIELDEGAEYPFHLMVTANHQFETDKEAEEWAVNLRNIVASNDWHIERMKLEAQMGEGPGEYYEAHWRVGFLDSMIEKVISFTRRYPQFKYSWSLLDREKKYFTARYFEYEPSAAQKYFQELTNLLGSNFKVTKAETERVVIDTNPEFDRGWAYVTL
jgi:hypothetical protein